MSRVNDPAPNVEEAVGDWVRAFADAGDDGGCAADHALIEARDPGSHQATPNRPSASPAAQGKTTTEAE